MKIFASVLFMAVLASIPSAALAATPKLIEFKGKYVGSVNYASAFFGTTNATIKASKKKDVGSITLNSVISNNGTPTPVLERVTISKKTGSYLIQVSGTTGTGSGRVRVSEKTITYAIPFTANGDSYLLNGMVKRTKKGLTVIHTISGHANFVISYTLKRSGK